MEKAPGQIVPKTLLTVEEATWSLGISKSKLYTLIAQEEIPIVKLGGRTLFLPDDLRVFAERYRRPKG